MKIRLATWEKEKAIHEELDKEINF